MKKISLSVLALVLIICVWQGIAIYRHIMSQSQLKAEQAVKKVQALYPVKTIESVREYRGTKAYEVILAKLKDTSHLYIWVPEASNQESLVTAKPTDGYTEKEIIQSFKQKVPYKRLISTNLGLMNQSDPVWEMIYVDPNNNFVYSYYDFYTGKSVVTPIAFH